MTTRIIYDKKMVEDYWDILNGLYEEYEEFFLSIRSLFQPMELLFDLPYLEDGLITPDMPSIAIAYMRYFADFCDEASYEYNPVYETQMTELLTEVINRVEW